MLCWTHIQCIISHLVQHYRSIATFYVHFYYLIKETGLLTHKRARNKIIFSRILKEKTNDALVKKKM